MATMCTSLVNFWNFLCCIVWNVSLDWNLKVFLGGRIVMTLVAQLHVAFLSFEMGLSRMTENTLSGGKSNIAYVTSRLHPFI